MGLLFRNAIPTRQPSLGTAMTTRQQFSWLYGLKAYWPMSDASGAYARDCGFFNSQSTGTLSGAAWEGWPLGACVHFDGVDDYIDIGNTPTNLQSLQSGDFSIALWMNPKTSGELGLGAMYHNNASSSVGLTFLIRDGYSNTLGLQLSCGFTTTASLLITADNSVILNEWHHYAVVFDGTAKTATAYRDGFALSSTTNTAGSGSAGSDSSTNLRLGNNSGATAWSFDGDMAEMRVYGRQLTPAELRALTMQPFCMFPAKRRLYAVEDVAAATNNNNLLLLGAG